MRLHDEIEWSSVKAGSNRKKHGVSFEVAMAVLLDEEGYDYHLEEYDESHSLKESRTITLGSLPADRSIVLWICWTDRSTKKKPRLTRIISARRATKQERKRYADEIKSR